MNMPLFNVGLDLFSDIEETIELEPETADSYADCVTCPEGYICLEKTGFRYDIPCPAGYYCPPGSGYPIICPYGCFCEGTGPGLIDIEDCPEGFFCPAGTIEP